MITPEQLRKAAKHERGKTYRVSDTALSQQLRDISESRAILYEGAADTIERLRETLQECGADFVSRSCTMSEASGLLMDELRRRAEIARAAIAKATESPADERDRRGSERSSRVARHKTPQENDHG